MPKPTVDIVSDMPLPNPNQLIVGIGATMFITVVDDIDTMDQAISALHTLADILQRAVDSGAPQTRSYEEVIFDRIVRNVGPTVIDNAFAPLTGADKADFDHGFNDFTDER